jgi:hypothetical protein
MNRCDKKSKNFYKETHKRKNRICSPTFSVRDSIEWGRKERARDDVQCNFWLVMKNSFGI